MKWSMLLFFVCLPALAEVPKTWDEKALADWAIPVTGLGARPGHFSEREYYQTPVENVRSYTVYHPDREPAGYWEWLKKQRPEPLIEPQKLRTEGNWIQAGRRVFEELDAADFRTADPEIIKHARSREWLAEAGLRPQADGSLWDYRWVVTPRGVQLSFRECGSCHTRHLPDGTAVHGAPLNRPGDGLGFELFFAGLTKTVFAGDTLPMTLFRQYGVPWLKPDPHERLKTMDQAEIQEMFISHIPGTFARFNGSPFYLTKMPDLIGLRDRKYIDHTGTHRHRGPGDVMRYAALVDCCDVMDFGPHRMLSDQQRVIRYHPPDEMLYALALYIYSLEPPANPYRADTRAPAGKAIFEREGCETCHTPPLYTNNKLTPALGFKPPKEHFQMMDILDVTVGTDPNLALKTRKGTGYYKVPSLKGVWYRGLYLHDGAVASLEDLFNPDRLSDKYLPSGFRGHRVQTRAVPGHEFGLKLKLEEKASLLAFLRTL